MSKFRIGEDPAGPTEAAPMPDYAAMERQREALEAYLYPPVPDFGDQPMTNEMREVLDEVVRARHLHKKKFGVDRLPTAEEILSFIRVMRWPTMNECANFFEFKKVAPNRMSIDCGAGPRTVAVDHDPELVRLILRTVQEHPDSKVQESQQSSMLSDGVIYTIPGAPYLPLVFYMPPL